MRCTAFCRTTSPMLWAYWSLTRSWARRIAASRRRVAWRRLTATLNARPKPATRMSQGSARSGGLIEPPATVTVQAPAGTDTAAWTACFRPEPIRARDVTY